MSPRLLVGILGAVVLASSGCWRTHVYAITEADAAPSPEADAKPAIDADAKSTINADTKPAIDADAKPDVPDTVPDAPPDAIPDTKPDVVPDTKPAIVCPSSVLKPGDNNFSLPMGSGSRSYLLHVPSSYDGRKPVPLIVDFHGMPSTGADESASSTYPKVTDGEGVLIAYPEGLTGTLGRGWNFGPCCVSGADDFGFAKALVAHLQTVGCIDPDRIYAVGTLTGSGMVYLLACQAADIFAAVAPAAFDLVEQTVNDCKPSRPITVVSFRGTSDSHVPYGGGPSNLISGMNVNFLGAEATFEKWSKLDECTGSPSAKDSHGCSRYTNCRGGVEVVLCTKDGGKEEPGDATIAWPTLKRYTR